MRGIISAVLVFVLALVGPSALERFVKDVPEHWWRLVGTILVTAALLIAALSDPFYQWLRQFHTYPFKSLAVVSVATGILAGAIWLFLVVGFPSSLKFVANQKPEASEDQTPGKDELSAAVVSFKYDGKTEQLIASVAFTNPSKQRRTILDVSFIYRIPGEEKSNHHPLVDDPLNFSSGTFDSPFYIEPHSEQVQTYKRKIDPKLVEQDGNIFGLWITSLERHHSFRVITIIEAMRIEPFRNTHVRAVSTKKVSLEEFGGGYFIEHPMIEQPTAPPSPTPNNTASPPPQASVPSLHDRFKTDFGLGARIAEREFQLSNGARVTVSFRIHFDYVSRSKFVSAYVPHSNLTFDVCQFIPSYLEKLLDERDSSLTMIVFRATDAVPESSDDLVFTKKVYVYHETHLTPQQLGSLHELYEKAGLQVSFRGRQYASTRWLQERAG
jgi:hypothetical protein